MTGLLLGGCNPAARFDPTEPDLPVPPPLPTELEPELTGTPSPVGPDPAALRDLDFERCLDLAIRFNRDQQRSRYAVERSRLAQVAARRTLFDPRLRASYDIVEGDDQGSGRVAAAATWGGVDIEPFIEVGLDRGATDDWSSAAGILFSRQLFRPSEAARRRLPLTRATRDLHARIYDRVRELRELRLQVARGFLRVQQLEARLAIRRARVADAEQFLADIEARVPKTAAPIEATNARIDLYRARADLIAEETSLREAEEALLDLMGADLDAELGLEDLDLGAWQEPEIDLAADLARIVVEHERVRVFDMDTALAEIDLRIARDALHPDLAATLTLRHERDGDDPFDDRLGSDESVAVGLVLQLPLDGYRSERARWQQQVLDLRARELELIDLRRDLQRDLRDRFRRIDQLRRTVELARERNRAEQEKLAASLQRYRDGTLDNLEVTRAKESAEAAELALLQASIDHFLAVAGYRAALPPASPPPPPPEAVDAP